MHRETIITRPPRAPVMGPGRGELKQARRADPTYQPSWVEKVGWDVEDRIVAEIMRPSPLLSIYARKDTFNA